MSADSAPPPGGTFKAAAGCGKETLALLPHPNSVCKLPTDKGASGAGSPRRTGQARPSSDSPSFRSGGSSPFVPDEGGRVEVPSSLVSQPQRNMSPRSSWGSGKAQGGRVRKARQEQEFLGLRGCPGVRSQNTAGMAPERPHVATMGPDLQPPMSTGISRAKGPRSRPEREATPPGTDSVLPRPAAGGQRKQKLSGAPWTGTTSQAPIPHGSQSFTSQPRGKSEPS